MTAMYVDTVKTKRRESPKFTGCPKIEQKHSNRGEKYKLKKRKTVFFV